ncbi:MAG: hypothetical protein DHS20C21_07530 [Gemmatimonadota bacterium]|nr:MAG: hypothetical protein DHS20C21_07530 [Gemmatimonadota bacterium]
MTEPDGPAPATDTLVMTEDFPHVPVSRLFARFVEPAELTRWWPESAQVEPRKGGAYCLAWPSLKWMLRGTYARFEAGRALEFSWAWDHEPDLPTRVVTLEFAEHEGGSRLTLTQGTYGPQEKEQEDRKSHRLGWTYFFSKLRRLDTPDDE